MIGASPRVAPLRSLPLTPPVLLPLPLSPPLAAEADADDDASVLKSPESSDEVVVGGGTSEMVDPVKLASLVAAGGVGSAALMESTE